MTAIEKIYESLYSAYGPQGWWPVIDRNSIPMCCRYTEDNTTKIKSSEEIFEICIGAILTQNTTWSNAEKALVSLIQADHLNPVVVSDAEPDRIAQLITSSGYYNMKAKKLKSFASFYLTNPEPDRNLFLSQWGLGPETADDMLLYAYDQPVFVVDLYTKRLFSRHGLCNESIAYEELQQLITNQIDIDIKLYKEFHALIVRHAKEYCRKSPVCTNCNIFSNCPSKIHIP